MYVCDRGWERERVSERETDRERDMIRLWLGERERDTERHMSNCTEKVR